MYSKQFTQHVFYEVIVWKCFLWIMGGPRLCNYLISVTHRSAIMMLLFRSETGCSMLNTSTSVLMIDMLCLCLCICTALRKKLKFTRKHKIHSHPQNCEGKLWELIFFVVYVNFVTALICIFQKYTNCSENLKAWTQARILSNFVSTFSKTYLKGYSAQK